MDIKEFEEVVNEKFYEYMKENNIKLTNIFKYIIDEKSGVITSHNPLNYVLIIYNNNTFFVTDRMIDIESSYVIKVEFKRVMIKNVIFNHMKCFKISNIDDDSYKMIDFENDKISGCLNTISVIQLLENILSFNTKE